MAIEFTCVCPFQSDLRILQVDSRQEIAPGSEMEVEIRACTIAAVEALRRALGARLSDKVPAAGPSSEAESTSTQAVRGAAAHSKTATADHREPAFAAGGAAAAGAAAVDGSGALYSHAAPAGVTAVAVDWWLWGRGEAERESAPQHHRTLTIYY